MEQERFLHDTICLNVLASDLENAKEIYEVTEGHVIIGLLSANFQSVDEAVEQLELYDRALDGAISLGLGGGDPHQSEMVIDISRKYSVSHINQVFTAVGQTRAIVEHQQSWINALIHPTKDIHMVNIATGPLSSQQEETHVPIWTAIAMVRDMGGNSVKFFPMGGVGAIEQYKQVATICAEENFALEPTGGVDLDNFKQIVKIALQKGVPKVIPHVYSSIIDSTTGKTRVKDVKKLYSFMKELTAQY